MPFVKWTPTHNYIRLVPEEWHEASSILRAYKYLVSPHITAAQVTWYLGSVHPCCKLHWLFVKDKIYLMWKWKTICWNICFPLIYFYSVGWIPEFQLDGKFHLKIGQNKYLVDAKHAPINLLYWATRREKEKIMNWTMYHSVTALILDLVHKYIKYIYSV